MFYEYNHLGSPDYIKIEQGKNFSFPAHLHQCFEIITVHSGQMNVTIDRKTFTLQKGEAVLIFPNQIHSLDSTQSEHLLCIFSPQLVPAYSTKVSGTMPTDSRFKPDAYLLDALKSLDDSSSSAEKKGVLYSLCAKFDKTAVYEEKQSDNSNLLYKIFKFVENDFAHDCSLSGLSKITGYDYSYLSHYFKRTTGISFNSYVTYYRLSHACYLLENTTSAIVQCAFDSGFTSLRSFNRCFKNNYGITPTMYRKNISI